MNTNINYDRCKEVERKKKREEKDRLKILTGDSKPSSKLMALMIRRNPPQVRVKADKKFVPKLFTLYCKLLCDCFKYISSQKRNHF